MKKYCSGPVRISYNANLSFHYVRKNKRGVSKTRTLFFASVKFSYHPLLFVQGKKFLPSETCTFSFSIAL